jgi:hypothetical protein
MPDDRPVTRGSLRKEEISMKSRLAIVVGSLFVGLFASLGVATAAHHSATSLGPSAVPAFAALARAQQAGDRLPAQLQQVVVAMNANPAPVSADLYEGQQLPAQSRLLLGNPGGSNAGIYAYPTTKGRVCFLITIGGGGCVTAADPSAWGIALNPGGSLAVYGLVPNTVRSVDVVVGGTSVPARIGQNAFFYEQQTLTDTPTALVATFANGTQKQFTLPARATLLRLPGS